MEGAGIRVTRELVDGEWIALPGGELEGRPARYDACSKPECKKKVVEHGLCQEHFDAWKKARKKNQGAAAEAPAPAAPAA